MRDVKRSPTQAFSTNVLSRHSAQCYRDFMMQTSWCRGTSFSTMLAAQCYSGLHDAEGLHSAQCLSDIRHSAQCIMVMIMVMLPNIFQHTRATQTFSGNVLPTCLQHTAAYISPNSKIENREPRCNELSKMAMSAYMLDQNASYGYQRWPA